MTLITIGKKYQYTGNISYIFGGEILAAAARVRGGRGAVIDGFLRDTPRVLKQNWPVFSRGRYAQDAAVRSSVIVYRCTVEIEGVKVSPGDFVFGDMDGVVIVPQADERTAITKALEKPRGEKVVRKEIEAGASSTSGFRKHEIL